MTGAVVAVVGVGSGVAALGAVHAVVNARLLRRPTLPPPPCFEPVSVCVPARDEGANIGACVEAIRASVGVGQLEVLVLDDGSTDATGRVASAAGARVVTGRKLPGGWLGKPHACAQLAEIASGSVLIFVDADVRVVPGAVAATVDLLRRHRLDMVSPYPRQLALTPVERLVQPLLQWTWLTFLPVRWSERHGPDTMVAANGQLLAVDAAAYLSVGGHSAVKGSVIEDVWLARAFKQMGKAVAVVDGTELATCRMYDSWPALRGGYTKSLWAAGSASTAGLLALAYLVPPAAALFGRGRARALGLAGYVAAVAGRAVSARRTGGRVADSAFHPVSVALLIGLGVRSRRAKRTGLLRWKGRPVG